MKKMARVLVLFLFCGLFVLLGGSLALGMYYRNNFPVNTWINGIYCTGKTIDEVNREMIRSTEISPVVLVDEAGKEWTLEPELIGLQPDYREPLQAYLKQYATFFWMNHLSKPVEAKIEVQYLCDETKLKERAEELDFVRRELERPEGCLVEYSEEEGYRFRDGNVLRLEWDRALTYIRDCLREGKLKVFLEAGNCYRQLEDRAEDLEQRLLWAELERFLSRSIVYDMGAEQLKLTPAILSGFVRADQTGKPLLEGGSVALDEEGVERWVEELAEAYDTCDKTLAFQATSGEVVNIQYVTYGTQLDAEAEKEYLMEALRGEGAEALVRVPSYKKKGYVRGLDDIGKTYIEVDMTKQHLYYYRDGQIEIETDVVTGDIGNQTGTPEGVNYVYNKQRDRILRGGDYATPVKFWMPVKGGLGLHDAGWRKKFGGEIYKWNGSHGCINIPPKVMEKIYEAVEVGTPVIMFYSHEQ